MGVVLSVYSQSVRSARTVSFYQKISVLLPRNRVIYLLPSRDKENWIQGGGDRVSVHFAVTFLDCSRTSFCVTTITKGSRFNVNKHVLVYGESSFNAPEMPDVCLSFVLLFTIFIFGCYAKINSPAVQNRHCKVYGNPIAPSFYSILLGSSFRLHPTGVQNME